MLLNPTKVDPRVKRTKKLLQQAMMDLLREQPVHSITVQDIAERAEVNRATFYAHFDDKYALLNYTVRDMFQQKLDSKLPESPTFTLENLRLLTLAVCDYLDDFLGHCSPSAHQDEKAIMVRQVQVYIYEVILDWVGATPAMKAQRDVSPEVIGLVTSSAIFGSVLQWAANGHKLAPDVLTDQILMTLTSGLGAYLRAP